MPGAYTAEEQVRLWALDNENDIRVAEEHIAALAEGDPRRAEILSYIEVCRANVARPATTLLAALGTQAFPRADLRLLAEKEHDEPPREAV